MTIHDPVWGTRSTSILVFRASSSGSLFCASPACLCVSSLIVEAWELPRSLARATREALTYSRAGMVSCQYAVGCPDP